MSETHVAGLHGLVLITTRLEAQRTFYRDVLRLPTQWSTADAHVFSVGGQALGLFAPSHHLDAAERLRGDTGISHLEFSVHRRALPSLNQALQQAGAGLHPGNYLDADGNQFHFVLLPDDDHARRGS